jgi:hypothetical protein
VWAFPAESASAEAYVHTHCPSARAVISGLLSVLIAGLASKLKSDPAFGSHSSLDSGTSHQIDCLYGALTHNHQDF